MHPTRTTRSLVRVILGLLAVSWLLAAGEGVTEAPCEAAEAARFPRHIPPFCERMNGLDLDFLNDQINPIQAFKKDTGTILAGRTAKFHVYALTDDPRYYANLTFETSATRLRLRTAVGSEDLPGRWEYRETSNNPVWMWTPTGPPTKEDRIGFIDVTYHCRRPTVLYRTQFMLTVRGARDDVAYPPGSDLTAYWEGAQLTPDRSGAAPRYRLAGSLRLRNQGEVEAGATRAAVFLSQDRVPGVDDQLAGFVDLPPLAAGAEVPVVVEFNIPALPWSMRRNVILMIDPANDASESNEANNLAVFGPLP